MRFICCLCSSILAITLTTACASPTHYGSSSLEGNWLSAVERHSPYGWYRRSLTFEATGSFIYEYRSYGIHQGQPRDQLSSYMRIEGTYRAERNRLIFQVREPRPYGTPPGTIFDDARYEVRGPQLLLHFTSYPADAPVRGTFVFTRAR